MFNLSPIPWQMFWWPLLLSFLLGYLLTWAVKYFSTHYKLFSKLTSHQLHTYPVARLGGVAIFITFITSFLLFVPLDQPRIGLLIALGIIFLMGLLDDLINLRPWQKLLMQLLAVAVALQFGIHIGQINNPLGGSIVFSPVWDLILSGAWLMVITNAMNLLDGLDGLASGTSAIGAVVLFFLSWLPMVNQPDMALMAVILFGTMLGFLRWNWYPAKIFMGDSGSNVLGFLLGALAIINGAKLATAVLVLGFPILDLLWAIVRRLRAGKHPFSPDKEHLHHRLIAARIPHPWATTIILIFVALFGLISLLSGSMVKLLALPIVAILMILVARTAIRLARDKSS